MREKKWRWRATRKPETVADWAEVQELERDILLLYHQLMDYNHIMGDLDYADVFNLPYWDYLNPTGLDKDRGTFIQEGCLVMLLSMAWDQINDSGSYLGRHHREIAKAIEACNPIGNNSKRLLIHVGQAVDAALNNLSEETLNLLDESSWVHKTIIGGYFLAKASAEV